MNAKTRLTTVLAAVAAAAALICACVKQPEGVARDNPFDQGGSNWHPPLVTAMNDTIVKPGDSIAITATGTDNGAVVKYVWAKNGTVYSDTTDSGALKVAWPGLGREVVRVKAIDDDGLVSSPDSCVVIVTLDPPVPDAGQDTTVSINDIVELHGSATDGFGYIASWAWDIGNTGTFVVMSGGEATFTAPASENLNYRCVLRVTDDDGNTAKDTVRIIVRQDVPIANAGNDTAVWSNDTITGINDTIRLHGSASQQFGSIVKWEWKIGSGSWTATGGPDTTVIMPDTSPTCICSLAVTDDDGNRAVDGMKIFFVDSGMVACWSFNETADSVLIDGSGNGNTAFIHTATRVGGVKGNALSFNGTSDYAHADNSTSLAISNQITIECWVNVRQVTPVSGSGQTFIRKEKAYALGIGNGGKIGFQICDGSGNWHGGWTLSSQSIQTSTWYHIAGVWDGTTMKMYINGVRDPTAYSYSGTGPSSSSTYKVYIGEFFESAYERLNGTLDELKVYKYALSAEMILAHYHR